MKIKEQNERAREIEKRKGWKDEEILWIMKIWERGNKDNPKISFSKRNHYKRNGAEFKRGFRVTDRRPLGF